MNKLYILLIMVLSFLVSTSQALIVICGQDKVPVHAPNNIIDISMTIGSAFEDSTIADNDLSNQKIPLEKIQAGSFRFILKIIDAIFDGDSNFFQKNADFRESVAKENLSKNKEKVVSLLHSRSLAQIISDLKDINFLQIPEIQDVLIDVVIDRITTESFLIHEFAANSGVWKDFKSLIYGSLEPLILDRVEQRYPDIFKQWREGYSFVESNSDIFTDEYDALPILFSHNGLLLAHVSDSNILTIRDARTGAVVHQLSGHTNFIWDFAFNHDDTMIVTASDDSTVKIWSVATGKLLRSFNGHTSSVSSVCFDHSGTRIASASADHTAIVWNTQTGGIMYRLEGHEEGLLSAAFNHSGTMLVTTSADATAKVWSMDTGELLYTFDDHESAVTDAFFDQDGRRVFTVSNDHMVIKCWDLSDGSFIYGIDPGRDSIWHASLSADGTKIVIALEIEKAKIYNAVNGELLHTLKGHTDQVLKATFSADGKRVVTASDDDTVRIWDVDTGSLLLTFPRYDNPVYYAAFNAQGNQIATTSSTNENKYFIKVWLYKNFYNHSLDQALLNILCYFLGAKGKKIDFIKNKFFAQIAEHLSLDYKNFFRTQYGIDFQLLLHDSGYERDRHVEPLFKKHRKE